MIYWAYAVGPTGAIVSPFFLGMVADRFFSTEKVLAALHLIGVAAMFFAPVAAEAGSAGVFILLLLIHMLCYMPTVGLANALAFHHMTDQEKYVPIIRVFGTIGWIVAGIIVSAVLGADETGIPLRVAGIAGVVMGLYAYTLPHTPPSRAGLSRRSRGVGGVRAEGGRAKVAISGDLHRLLARNGSVPITT